MVFESGDPRRLEGQTGITVSLINGCVDFEIEEYRPFAGFAKVKLRGINSVELAELLRNGELVISGRELPQLADGEFYIDQLIGCRVEADDGENLGSIANVLDLGHQDIWSVSGDHGEILIPARKEFIVRVDIQEKLVVVRRIPGLWDGA